MNNTKEMILQAALRLFAENGYEAVSVSDISGSLGIAKSALYKHYESKRDIFDSIVKRMIETDAKRARDYRMPETELTSDSGCNASPEEKMEFTKAQFMYWTEDPFASLFRKMLTVEQYRNREMAVMYDLCLLSGPVRYTAELLGNLIPNKAEALEAANQFYAPVFLYICAYDSADDKEKIKDAVFCHINSFYKELNKRKQKNDI